jgi:hypothetical protein
MSITLEQVTQNVITTKGLFAIPVEAFQFDWNILNRIFVSTFKKYERFCPLIKTLQTFGGNPYQMPDDCIYPRSIAFGNAAMIAPQAVTVDSQSWTYDRTTKMLSVFTNTGSSAPFKVQYLARHPEIEVESDVEPFEVFEGEEEVEIKLNCVPNPSTLTIAKGDSTLAIKSRGRHCWQFEGTLGTAELDLTSLVLTITQTDTSAGMININYKGQYKCFGEIAEDDAEFFETWYAANILTSLGNIKAIVRMDAMPNSISADNLQNQGQALMEDVLNWQKEKQFWFRGYMGSRT